MTVYAAAIVGLQVKPTVAPGAININTVLAPFTVSAVSRDEAVGMVVRMVDRMKEVHGDGPGWSWRYSVNIKVDHLVTDPNAASIT
jgi:hypothetical protein